MRTQTKNSLQLWRVARPKRPRKAAPPPKIYSRRSMPVVDAHMHIGKRDAEAYGSLEEAAEAYLAIMDDAGVAVSINLSGSPEVIQKVDSLHQVASGRILTCPGTYFRKDVRELWWSMRDLESFKHENIAGLKIWCKYQQPLLKPSVAVKIQRQAELNLPAVGMHIADPPERGFWAPNYWQCISDAERTIRSNPGLTFIMAHGFWLMVNDEGLDVLATYFDAYPNLHVDLSAAYQWWDGAEPTYDKLRNFIIRYKDRILYGTDGNPGYSMKRHFDQTYEVLETKQKGLLGFFSKPDAKTHIYGLDLPIEVLNYIYYWNAARLIPHVRSSLTTLGYTV